MALHSRSLRIFIGTVLTLSGVLASAELWSGEPVHDVDLKVKYKISFLGFDLARANFAAKFEHGLYAARVGYKTTGIVKVFAAANGDVSVTGAIESNRVIPAEFHQATKENSKDSSVEMVMSQGNVVTNVALPEHLPDPNRVPVRDENRKGILDPLSALLIPIGKNTDQISSACNRTIPIFDGWTRFDIALSLKETKSLDKGPFKGDVVVCSVRWVPIAGHVPTRAGTKFMMDNKNIEVMLAPIGDSGYVAPIHIGVETLHGHVDIDATDFVVAKAEAAPAN